MQKLNMKTQILKQALSKSIGPRILNAFPKQPHDSINQFIKPTIIEKGRDPMVGNEMTYNLDTKKENKLRENKS